MGRHADLFQADAGVPSLDIVAHRIVWSLLVLVILLTRRPGLGPGRAPRSAIARSLLILLLTALLIGTNWLLYVYAINSGHILAGSLGYYLNPLANILLGRFILERAADAAAMGGGGDRRGRDRGARGGRARHVVDQPDRCASASPPTACCERSSRSNSLAGLTIETACCSRSRSAGCCSAAPTGRPMFGIRRHEQRLCWSPPGIVSTVPLLCFTAAARRLPYSTVGMLQFIAPTLQFLLAVAALRRAFHRPPMRSPSAAIWTALALYVSSLIRDRRASQQARESPKPELGEALKSTADRSRAMLNIVSLIIGVVALSVSRSRLHSVAGLG